MEFKTTSLPKSELEIEITIPFSGFEPHLKRAAAALSEEIDIEGFRRGKAPYDIVKNKVGEIKIYQRAGEIAVRKTYPEALQKIADEEKNKKKEFIPIGRPEVAITTLASQQDFRYRVKITLLPQVTLPDYKKIAQRVKKGKKEVSISDEEIGKTLEWVQNSRAKLVTVNRPAQKGDAVEIDFSAKGGSASGGEARNNDILIDEQKNFSLILGKGRLLPGFEDHLAGMKTGEEKKFTLLVPEEWAEKSLAGKTLNISVVMKLVQERELPELTNEFAKGLGDFASLDALKENIRRGIGQEKEEKERQRIRARMAEEISKEALVEIPEVMIKAELDKMMRELQAGVLRMGMKWEDYLSHIRKTAEDLQNGWRKDAEERVRQGISLRAIAMEEHIEIGPEEVEARSNEFLRQYGSIEEARKEIDPEEMREYTKGVLRNEKVFELLENIIDPKHEL